MNTDKVRKFPGKSIYAFCSMKKSVFIIQYNSKPKTIPAIINFFWTSPPKMNGDFSAFESTKKTAKIKESIKIIFILTIELQKQTQMLINFFDSFIENIISLITWGAHAFTLIRSSLKKRQRIWAKNYKRTFKNFIFS